MPFSSGTEVFLPHTEGDRVATQNDVSVLENLYPPMPNCLYFFLSHFYDLLSYEEWQYYTKKHKKRYKFL
jgi:hypothetical protein